MKKSIFTLLIAVMAVFANAQAVSGSTADANGYFVYDAANYCNHGSVDASNPRTSGLLATHCVISFNKLTVGFNPTNHQFFFDTDYKVKVGVDQNGQDVFRQIRFDVLAGEAEYNGIQAAIQTAYAMRSTVHVIFENPLHHSYSPTDADAATKRQSGLCADNGYYFYCPVFAFQLDYN
jgi:hypothetical protein